MTNELWTPCIWAVSESQFVWSLHSSANTGSDSVTRRAASYRSPFSTWFQLFGVSCISAVRGLAVHTLTDISVSKHGVWPVLILRSNLIRLAQYDVLPSYSNWRPSNYVTGITITKLWRSVIISERQNVKQEDSCGCRELETTSLIQDPFSASIFSYEGKIHGLN